MLLTVRMHISVFKYVAKKWRKAESPSLVNFFSDCHELQYTYKIA
jgi:hypothetical protein